MAPSAGESATKGIDIDARKMAALKSMLNKHVARLSHHMQSMMSRVHVDVGASFQTLQQYNNRPVDLEIVRSFNKRPKRFHTFLQTRFESMENSSACKRESIISSVLGCCSHVKQTRGVNSRRNPTNHHGFV
jgi:hypothetical protein